MKYAVTAPGAQIIEYGWLSGAPTPFPLFPAFQKELMVRGYTLYEFVHDPVLRPQAEEFVNEHLAQGKLRPKIDRTFPLSQVIEAHRHLESNRKIGKVVVTVEVRDDERDVRRRPRTTYERGSDRRGEATARRNSSASRQQCRYLLRTIHWE